MNESIGTNRNIWRILSALAATAIWGFYSALATAFSNLGAQLGLPLFVIGGLLVFGLAHALSSARKSPLSAVIAVLGIGILLLLAAASEQSLQLFFATDTFELDSETAVALLLAAGVALPAFGWPSAGTEQERRRAQRTSMAFLAVFAAACAAYGFQTRERPIPPLYRLIMENQDPGSIREAISETSVHERVRGTDDVPHQYLGQTPLHAAARQREAGLVEDLLRAGADAGAKDELFRTPLHAALETKDVSGQAAPVVRLLLAAGADPDAPDIHGKTPLHHAAARSDDPSLVSALIAAGADTEFESNPPDFGTPLLLAVEYGHPAAVAALLAAGANPHEVNHSGQSALSVLLERCPRDGSAGSAQDARIFTEKLRILLQGGSDPLARDRYGTIPLDLARKRCSPEIVAALQRSSEGQP